MRKVLGFTPEWEGPIENWCCAYIHKNLWRVAPFYEFDDLYQDAFMFFMICCDRYYAVVEAPHFMALMKTCLRNHFNEVSLSRKGYFTESAISDLDDESLGGIDAIAGVPQENAADFMMDVESRWPTVYAYITGVISDEEYVEESQPVRRRTKSEKAAGIPLPRPTMNDQMSKTAGLDPKMNDVRGIVTQFLHEGVYAIL